MDADSSIFLTKDNIDNDKTLLNKVPNESKIEESKLQFEETSGKNTRPTSSAKNEFNADFESLVKIKQAMNRNVF